MPINYLRLLFVSLVTALFTAAALAQENPGTRQAADQYLVILKLAGNKDYGRVIVLSKQLIEQAPHFIQAYGILVEASLAAGQLDQTKDYLKELAARAVPNPGAHYGLGLIHYEQGADELAVSSCRHSLEIEPESAPVYRALVLAYREMKKTGEAEEYLKSVAESRPNSPAALYGLGLAYSQQRKYPEGLAALEQSIAINQQFGAAHNLKGNIYLRTEKYAEALASYQAAYEIAETRGDAELKCQALTGKGVAHVALANYPKAFTDLTAALRMAEEIGDRSREVVCLSNIGEIKWLLGDRSSALDLWQRVLQVSQEILRIKRDPTAKQNMGRHLGNIGLSYHNLGEHAEAANYYQRATEMAVELNDQGSLINNRINLGIVYTELNNYVQAKPHFVQALQAARGIHSSSLESRALSGLADLYRQSGDTQAALDHIQQAMRLAQETGDLMREGDLHNSLGGLYLSLRDLPSAVAAYQRGLEIGESIHVPLIVWQAHAGLAATAARLNRFDEARQHYQKAIEALERMRESLGTEDERVGFFQDKVKFYKDLFAALMRMHVKDATKHYDAEAFHISERGRARAFLDLLGEARNVDQAIDPDLLKRRKEIQADISKLNTQLIAERSKELAKQDMANVKKLEEALGKADAEEAGWRGELQRRNRRIADLKYPEPLKLEQARRTLDNQSLILSYSLGEQSSFLFAVSHNGHLATPLKAPAAEIRDRVEKMIVAMTDRNNPSPEEYRRQAARLYQLLIQPAGKLLAGKRELIIIADDALHRLPFQALIGSPSAKGAAITSSDPRRWPYLVGQFAISYAPSVSAWVSLKDYHKGTGAPQKAFVAYADPNYNRQGQLQNDSIIPLVTRGPVGEQLKLARLPHSRHEVEEIGRLFGEGEAKLYLGDEASEENVKAEDRLSRYRIVHFSAHGLISATRPRLSGILLSLPNAGKDGKTAQEEDGLLSAYEIFNLKLNAELVTLSACETGLGKEVRGEGMMGLMRAFMYAGTPSVVVSLWKVDDESAADLMIGFYKYWQGGGKGKLSKAEALRRAQLDAIKQGSLPYYWAPFILVGKS
jgi:CHAT domain-containing protein/tetratricopeptide (TPR) repeat protein